MRFGISALLVATLALGAGGARAQNGSIRMGNVADPYCNTGYTLYFPGGFGNILLTANARLAGLTAGGISGAEFYIDGVEGLGTLGWSGTASAGIPAGQIDGNFLMPGGFGVRRGNISFGQTCPSGGGPGGTPGIVPLLTVSLGNPTGSADIATDTRLEIVAGSPPSNPTFPCPVLTLCDAPAFTKVCVPGGPFFINPTAWCTDAVTPKSWSAVKNLFRPHP